MTSTRISILTSYHTWFKSPCGQAILRASERATHPARHTIVSLSLAALVSVVAYPGLYTPTLDATHYVAIAEGRHHEAYFYYAGRVLHPYAVRALSALTGWNIRQSFFALAVFLLVAFAVMLAIWLSRTGCRAGATFLVLATPACIVLYRDFYLQDLMHAVLLLAFLLTALRQPYISLPLLFLLHLTRESTTLLTVTIVAISIWRREWRLAVAALVTGVAGIIVASVAVSQGLPNKHGVNPLIMYVVKMPFNFFINICGLVFWTNTNADSLTFAPVWRWSVPQALHLGAIREIGFCGFRPFYLFNTFSLFLCTFGIAPGALLAMRARLIKAFPTLSITGQVAGVYGGVSLLAAPLIGTWVSRYIIYAWPLFWILVPMLVGKGRHWSSGWGALHLAITWLPVIVSPLCGSGLARPLVVGCIASVANWYAFRMIRREEARASAVPGA